jgi:DNA repair protein RadA/Sms
MAKVKKAYFCKECGYEAAKWMGRCPSCGAWNTFTEEIISKSSGSASATMTAALPKSAPQRVGDIRFTDRQRLDMGNAEVNRVLGGGLVPGSLVLLGGEPGIGKSTLSLQIALSDNGLRTLYVSGEESAEQIKMRADRIGIGNDSCMVYAETLLENIIAQIDELHPDLVVIDSIQTIYTDLVESAAGSVSQIRECAATLLKYAKCSGISILIIGHITKDGTIAGPKILEHIVDVVLQFEGDGNQVYRILRGIKNRFGATFEIGVFEMLETGLRAVDNPSKILLTHYDVPLSGIAVGASVDGIRPYLIEVQALVSNAAYGTPQRTATGFDYKRMSMLLAVLEKRVGLKMYTKDVFLNFAGGFKVADPGLDLSIMAAVISSYYDRPLAEGVCCAGEVGLSGEVRPAPRTEQRISEAARLGFRRIVVSAYLSEGMKHPKGIEVVSISSIDQLPKALFASADC